MHFSIARIRSDLFTACLSLFTMLLRSRFVTREDRHNGSNELPVALMDSIPSADLNLVCADTLNPVVTHSKVT